jgi:hypothetical protein
MFIMPFCIKCVFLYVWGGQKVRQDVGYYSVHKQKKLIFMILLAYIRYIYCEN